MPSFQEPLALEMEGGGSCWQLKQLKRGWALNWWAALPLLDPCRVQSSWCRLGHSSGSNCHLPSICLGRWC